MSGNVQRLARTSFLLLALTGPACGKKPPALAASPPPSAPPSEEPAAPPAAPAAAPGLSEEEAFARKTLAELNAEQPLNPVFFDVDQATLRDRDRAALQQNAEWLKRWSTTRIAIEGHCDSRGSSEYNLALGDRRAAAVRDYLADLGVARDRIVTISKGKDAPFCMDETEACWQENRRGHFVLVAK